jgi:hypothetical protein
MLIEVAYDGELDRIVVALHGLSASSVVVPRPISVDLAVIAPPIPQIPDLILSRKKIQIVCPEYTRQSGHRIA